MNTTHTLSSAIDHFALARQSGATNPEDGKAKTIYCFTAGELETFVHRLAGGHGAVVEAAAARPTPLSTPAGWRLVPVEPTKEMCLAEWNVSLPDAHTDGGVSECAWAAMLEAAPAFVSETLEEENHG